MRTSLFTWRGALLAALGLAGTGACSGSTSEGGGPAPFPCTGSQPELAVGRATGFERCEDGALHRPTVVECASTLPRSDVMCDTSLGGGDCTSDADCTANPNGYCSAEGQSAWCSCRYGCTTDADCADGRICLCGDPVGRCVTASCTSDAECGSGKLCSSYVTEPGCGDLGFACQTSADGCATDGDCTSGEQCTHDGTRHVCQQIGCAIGRPFLVHGAERLAPTEIRADWCDGMRPRQDDLDAATRRALVEHWTLVGRMEHASVAAFARFTLQLMALGAPPDLVGRSQRAGLDELGHARAAFGLAAAYAEAPVGPGPLEVTDALGARSAIDVLSDTVLEGCIGETVAAIEAAETAAHATDPVIRAVLERIAREEREHAELAWCTVKWLVARSPSLGAVFLELVTAARRPASGAPATLEATSPLLGHGVLSHEARGALRARVLEDVVLPCARRLVEASLRPPSASDGDDVRVLG